MGVRVRVRNDWIFGFWVRAIIIQVLGKYWFVGGTWILSSRLDSSGLGSYLRFRGLPFRI